MVSVRTFSVMCNHTLPIGILNLQITKSDIRPHIKWSVSLVTAHGHFNLPQGFVWGNILTSSAPRVDCHMDRLQVSVLLSLLDQVRFQFGVV